MGRLQSESISLHVTPEEKKAMVERMKEAVSPSMRAFILDMCMHGKVIVMAKIVKSLSLDVSRQNRIQAVVAKQYDKDSRFLKIQLMDEGEPIVVDQSSVVTINASRADNASKAFAGEVNEDGTVTVPITYWMLELDDKVGCDVSVVDAQGRKLSTLNFTIEVEHSNYSGDDISEDENYDLLVTLLAEVAEAKDAEAKRVVAENARVTAETNRVNAETARDTADSERYGRKGKSRSRT